MVLRDGLLFKKTIGGSMVYGLVDWPLEAYVWLVFLLTQLTAISISVYLHRHSAHRAVDLHPGVAHVFRFWLWLTTGMVTREWTAIHRKHHAACETDADPHSPQVLGLKTVLFQGAELYRRAKDDEDMLERYGSGTPDDWVEQHVYSQHSSAGILLLLLVEVLLFGIPGLIIWALQMMWTPLMAAGIINGMGHFWGYRNFEVPDASTNLLPWGILIAGEELHNNHHTYGTSAKFSVRWFEFDLGWMIIRLLERLDLAKAKRVPPGVPPVRQRPLQVNVALVQTFFTHRYQMMASYASEVIVPTFKAVRHELRGEKQRVLTRAASGLMIRHEALLGASQKRALLDCLQTSVRLQVVYRFKQDLQSIWADRTSAPGQLKRALARWCERAEKSGIPSLQAYALGVRTLA